MKTKKTADKTLPVLDDSQSIIKCTSWRNNEIRVAEIGDFASENKPEYFHTNDYAILFIYQGTLCGKFNQLEAEMTAPSAVYIFNDHVLHYKSNSPDFRARILGYSPAIAEELSLPIPYDKVHYAYVRPVMHLDEQGMRTVMHYLDFLEELMSGDAPNRHSSILHLIRSLVMYLIDFYTESILSQKPLSRPEELVGRFLSLVDNHCHEHHCIDWYANELCLTPKYVANVVKDVTNRTAGECINETLIRQAKSLLITSTLSIQQIADRLGFKNQSHFGTFFHRIVGMSPKKYRNSSGR